MNRESQTQQESRSLGPDALRVAGVGVAYLLARQFAFFFPDAHNVVMSVWPASGIGLAAFLLYPRRMWPAISAVLLAVAFGSNMMNGRPLCTSLGFTVADIAESFGAGWLITRRCGAGVRFGRVREASTLLVVVPLVMATTSCIAAGTAVAAGLSPFQPFWQTWCISGGLGNLIVAPLIVTWGRPGSVRRLHGWRLVEIAVFAAVLVTISKLALTAQNNTSVLVPRPYMYIAVLTWAAMRFGPRGVSFALAVFAALALSSPSVVTGPWAWGGDESGERLLRVQVFLTLAAVVGYLLAASGAQAWAAERAARAAGERLARAHADLRRRSRQLARLASELTLAEHRERRRLTEVLHDDLQQLLVAARLETESWLAVAGERERLNARALHGLLTEALGSSRGIAQELVPPVSLQKDLGSALEWLASRKRERHKLDVSVRIERMPDELPEATAVLLYTAARELLLNVVKHAGVSRAALSLRCDGDCIILDVRDEGSGFDGAAVDAAAAPRGFGLFSIRERAELLGGRLDIEAAPGRGTRATLVLPMAAPASPPGDGEDERADVPSGGVA